MSDKAKDNNANPLDVVNIAKQEVGVIPISDGEYLFTRSAMLMHREQYSEYRLANMRYISDGSSKIGGAIKSVERMRVNKAEMDVYMPTIIGEDVRSVDYNKKFEEYFSNLGVVVPVGGRTLDTSMTFKSVKGYNLFTVALKNILSKFANALKDVMDDDKDRDKKVDVIYRTKDDSIILLESKLYAYALPTNIGDYILWRYCLVYRDVANDEVRIEKSANIRFYLHDAKLKQQQEEAAFAIQSTATILYADLLTKKEDLMYVVWALSDKHSLDVRAATDHNKRSMLLDKVVKSDPNSFLVIAKHKDVKTMCFIEKAIAHGMINRIPNTAVVQDKEGNTLGSTLAEVVVFFKNRDLNGDFISRIENQLKTI